MPASSPRLALLLAALAAVGPFSIVTYLPAFPHIEADLTASRLEVQQTLTVYMIMFAVMALWHGAVSDRFGRRRVIVAGTTLFAIASAVCAFAQSIEWLWVGRALQGMSAGVGMVVGRAVIRDIFDGAQAQRLMSHVMMIFAVAPAMAPIFGGALLLIAGWRSIFVFLGLFSASLAVLAWRYLPETLAPEARQSLRPGNLGVAYANVMTNRAFLLLAGAIAMNFNGFFIYVVSAPTFLIEHLGLGPGQFGWLFVTTVVGIVAGSWVSGRVAGRWSAVRSISTGYGIMLAAVVANVLHAWLAEPSLPWSVLPVGIYTMGMALGMPSLSILALDLFPQRRGMASSCQTFMHVGLNALTAGAIAPLMWASPLSLGAGASLYLAMGLLAFLAWGRLSSRANEGESR